MSDRRPRAFVVPVVAGLPLLAGLLGPVPARGQSWQPPTNAERCPSKWGAGDERGAANHMRPETVLRAARLIRTGQTIELGHVLSPSMPLPATRQFDVLTKRTFMNPEPNRRGSNEELVVAEIGQVGTQFDGFAHQTIGDAMYNCFTIDETATRTGFTKLGIERVGTLMTRGVLVDVAALKGVDVLPDTYEITVDDIQQALARQNLTLLPGDAVLLHTGWGRWWEKDNARYMKTSPGLGVTAAEWLARQDPMLVGTDNSAINVTPNPDPAVSNPIHQVMLVVHGHPPAREPEARRAGGGARSRVRAGAPAAEDQGRDGIDRGARRDPVGRVRPDEGLRRWRVGEARPLHGAACARPRLRGGRCLPRAERRQARRVQGAHRHRLRRHQRSRGDPESRGGLRRGPDGARALGRAAVLHGHGPGGARPRAAGRAARLLVRLAHHARWPGRLLVEVQGPREGLRLDRAADALRRPRRPGGGLPANLRERHALDGGARQRSRRRRERGPARVEPPRGRSDPGEQPDAPGGLCAVHGGRADNDALVHEAPAIVGCRTPSALAHAAGKS
jgi:hypothetical protein